MHSIIIDKLGPIEHAELSDNKFMVFIGSQASGKSTIAKAIYFFRTVKDDILSMFIKKTTGNMVNASSDEKCVDHMNKILREKFLGIFGSSRAMSKEMQVTYKYSDETYINIKLDNDPSYKNHNFIMINYSHNIIDYFKINDNALMNYSSVIPESEITSAKEEINNLFHDIYEIVYIPAGRSMITLLAEQLNYIYTIMDDIQKRTIDLCTRSYIENIIKLRPMFSNGLQGIERDNPIKVRNNYKNITRAKKLANNVLKGVYRFNNGEDRLDIRNSRYVKINYASSGQQEAVWIVNLLFYYLVQGKPSFFIIEEPESHLFPEAQKHIIDLIAIFQNAGHSVLVTTHSPYVLGSINNLLYAGHVSEECSDSINKIIDSSLWLKKSGVSGWYINEGTVVNCVNDEIGLINEYIDEISNVINNDFDKMLSIKTNFDEEAGINNDASI